MAQTLDIHNLEGKVTGKLDLPEVLFNAEIKPTVLAQALRVYSANQRQATSKVKTRGEVNATTKKMWKQKGTGRARHGSKGAPIFVGGGVAHGPTGVQNYELKLTKKMRQLALKQAFSQCVKDDSLIIISGLSEVETSTKALVQVLKNLKVDTTKTVLMLESPLKNIVQASRNIKLLTVTQAKRTNLYEIMTAGKVVIHEPAIATLLKTFAPEVELPVAAAPKAKAVKAVKTVKPAAKKAKV